MKLSSSGIALEAGLTAAIAGFAGRFGTAALLLSVAMLALAAAGLRAFVSPLCPITNLYEQ